jgi:AMP deaminase
MEQCEIPGEHPFTFEIDDKGVIQVYDRELNDSSNERTSVYDIPSIREYFVDLDYVLGVISDGPTKSFAFRRLKYLASKFEMYSLLNEFQELSDMKVFFDSPIHSTMLNHPSSKFHIGNFVAYLPGTHLISPQ